MRKRKLILMIFIVFIFIMIVTGLDLMGFFTQTIIPLRSQYANFIESDGVITEVNFSGPFNHNKIELYEDINDINKGEEDTRIITTYDIEVRKSFFSSKKTNVHIHNSKEVEYIYILNFSDKVVTIKDGKIINWLLGNQNLKLIIRVIT